MKPPRLGDVVEVQWLDSEHVALGWDTVSAYVKAIKAPQSYRTAGYYIVDTKEHLLVALSIDPANRHITHAMSIPVATVTKVTVLGRSTKRVRKALR